MGNLVGYLPKRTPAHLPLGGEGQCGYLRRYIHGHVCRYKCVHTHDAVPTLPKVPTSRCLPPHLTIYYYRLDFSGTCLQPRDLSFFPRHSSTLVSDTLLSFIASGLTSSRPHRSPASLVPVAPLLGQGEQVHPLGIISSEIHYRPVIFCHRLPSAAHPSPPTSSDRLGLERHLL